MRRPSSSYVRAASAGFGAVLLFGLILNGGEDPLRRLVADAQAAEKQENLGEAVRIYTAILKIRPHWASAEFNLALDYHFLKRYSEAIPLFAEVIRHRPEFADAWFFRGAAYYQIEQFSNALSSLRRALELDPSHNEARFYLAGAYYALDDYNSAAREYLDLTRKGPRKSESFFHLAECHLALARASRDRAGADHEAGLAEQAADQLAELDPDSPYLDRLRARSLDFKGQPAAADSAYRKALSAAPQDSGLLIEYGKFKAAQREFDAALELYTQALLLDPNYSRLHGLLGEAYLMEGQPDRAIPSFRKALQANPGDAPSRIYLAQCLSQQGKTTAAISLLLEAPADGDGRIHYALGTYYARQGDHEKAAKAMQVFNERRKASEHD